MKLFPKPVGARAKTFFPKTLLRAACGSCFLPLAPIKESWLVSSKTKWKHYCLEVGRMDEWDFRIKNPADELLATATLLSIRTGTNGAQPDVSYFITSCFLAENVKVSCVSSPLSLLSTPHLKMFSSSNRQPRPRARQVMRQLSDFSSLWSQIELSTNFFSQMQCYSQHLLTDFDVWNRWSSPAKFCYAGSRVWLKSTGGFDTFSLENL